MLTVEAQSNTLTFRVDLVVFSSSGSVPDVAADYAQNGHLVFVLDRGDEVTTTAHTRELAPSLYSVLLPATIVTDGDESGVGKQFAALGEFCRRAAIPAMLEGVGGSIINTASTLGLIGSEGYAAYGAAKAGLVALTKRIATEYGPRHPSPNAGWSEAVMAGALGVQLGGPSTYGGDVSIKPFLGEPRVPIDRLTVGKAIRVMLMTSWLALLMAVGVDWAMKGF